MTIFYKSLHETELSDLTQLVANSVRENTELDYKLELPGNSDEAKRKFLTDVCAFANTSGGYLIFGIREEVTDGKKTGIPQELTGIENLNANEVQLWVESLVATSIEPRITGLQFQNVPINSTHSILLLRIPKSWNAPHAVSFRNHWRFYARNSAGNYPMNVAQVRDAFAMANELVIGLTAKRDEFLRALRYKYQEAPQNPTGVLAVHILPFDSYRPDTRIEVAKVRQYPELLNLAGEKSGAFSFNFDGATIQNGDDYLKIYHSGITEEIITGVFGNGPKGTYISSLWVSWDTMKSVGARLTLLRRLGNAGPVMVCISLLGINQRPLVSRQEAHGQLFELRIPRLPDRNEMITDPIIVESIGGLDLEGSTTSGSRQIPKHWDTAAAIIRPSLDAIWRGFGVEKCFEYNQKGELVGFVSAEDLAQVTVWLR